MQSQWIPAWQGNCHRKVPYDGYYVYTTAESSKSSEHFRRDRVIHILRSSILIWACCLVFLAGCGSKPGSQEKNIQSSVYPVTCIGILPAVSGADLEGTVSPEQQKALAKGVKVMNRLLAQEFGGQEKIIFVTEEHISGLQMTGGEKALDIARLIGKRVHCNAILETTVWRYSERIGTRYSVEEPASAAFDFRLIGIDNGAVLLSAKFDEIQKSVLENLYEWSKAKTRGFTWITVDELMLEGVREKLSKSPYFKQVLKKDKPDTTFEDLDEKV